MEFEIGQHKGHKMIFLSGEIDMHSSPVLRDALLNIIKEKPERLMVSFRNVSYIDSSGIATFVEGLKHMKTYNGRLQLMELPKGIMEIFNFSKLDKVFDICGNPDDAACR